MTRHSSPSPARSLCRRHLEPGAQSDAGVDRLPAELRRPRGSGQHAADCRTADVSDGRGGASLGRRLRHRRRRSGANGAAPSFMLSVDDVTYSQVATLTAPLRQGFLTSSLPAAAGWDAVDTLAVNLTESGGTLSGTSQAAAQQGGTLSLVDNEFLGYQVATLTTANQLQSDRARARARRLIASGTFDAARRSPASTARSAGSIFRRICGQELFFKFQSFNPLGGGLQDLSTCTVYTFRRDGAGLSEPDLRAARDRLPARSGTGRRLRRPFRTTSDRSPSLPARPRSRRHRGSGQSTRSRLNCFLARRSISA